MQNFPTNFSPMSPPPIQKKVRGAYLTTTLLLSTIGGVIWTFIIVMGGASLDRNLEGTALHHDVSRIIAFLAVVQFANLACLGGIWAWKKWGVYGSLSMTILGVLATMKMGHGFPTLQFGLSAAFFVAVFTRFHMFED